VEKPDLRRMVVFLNEGAIYEYNSTKHNAHRQTGNVDSTCSREHTRRKTAYVQQDSSRLQTHSCSHSTLAVGLQTAQHIHRCTSSWCVKFHLEIARIVEISAKVMSELIFCATACV